MSLLPEHRLKGIFRRAVENGLCGCRKKNHTPPKKLSVPLQWDHFRRKRHSWVGALDADCALSRGFEK